MQNSSSTKVNVVRESATIVFWPYDYDANPGKVVDKGQGVSFFVFHVKGVYQSVARWFDHRPRVVQEMRGRPRWLWIGERLSPILTREPAEVVINKQSHPAGGDEYTVNLRVSSAAEVRAVLLIARFDQDPRVVYQEQGAWCLECSDILVSFTDPQRRIVIESGGVYYLITGGDGQELDTGKPKQVTLDQLTAMGITPSERDDDDLPF